MRGKQHFEFYARDIGAVFAPTITRPNASFEEDLTDGDVLAFQGFELGFTSSSLKG